LAVFLARAEKCGAEVANFLRPFNSSAETPLPEFSVAIDSKVLLTHVVVKQNSSGDGSQCARHTDCHFALVKHS
jgi:hypothetical protein